MFESTLDSINNFRDSLGLKRAVSGEGSFRNVPFLILNEQKQSGGRRIVKREYPLKDTGGANDLGRKLRERTFSACILGKNIQAQSDALIEALDAAGAGELTHPDFGTVSVMIDSWESRRKADELNYIEFTITVFPASTDNAPEAGQDTASAVSAQKDSLFGSFGDTLSDAWQVVQEGSAGASAVLDAITGVLDDIYDMVENVGMLQDVNGLLSSLAALKGSAIGLINQPGILAANILGALSGLSGIVNPSLAFRSYERLGIHLAARKNTIDISHHGDAVIGNVSALFHVVTSATLASKAEAVSGILTQALDTSNSRDVTARAPELSVAPASSSSVSAATGNLQLNAITTGQSRLPLSSETDNNESDGLPLFESITDIESMAVTLGEQLDNAALQAGSAGYSTDSDGLNHMRLLSVYDLRKRGLRLPEVVSVTFSRTEPALVALYRVTGNSRQWQRMARRNGVINPSFVPGGIKIEVIDE